jgi:hypothetical protein
MGALFSSALAFSLACGPDPVAAVGGQADEATDQELRAPRLAIDGAGRDIRRYDFKDSKQRVPNGELTLEFSSAAGRTAVSGSLKSGQQVLAVTGELTGNSEFIRLVVGQRGPGQKVLVGRNEVSGIISGPSFEARIKLRSIGEFFVATNPTPETSYASFDFQVYAADTDFDQTRANMSPFLEVLKGGPRCFISNSTTGEILFDDYPEFATPTVGTAANVGDFISIRNANSIEFARASLDVSDNANAYIDAEVSSQKLDVSGNYAAIDGGGGFPKFNRVPLLAVPNVVALNKESRPTTETRFFVGGRRPAAASTLALGVAWTYRSVSYSISCGSLDQGQISFSEGSKGVLRGLGFNAPERELSEVVVQRYSFPVIGVHGETIFFDFLYDSEFLVGPQTEAATRQKSASVQPRR